MVQFKEIGKDYIKMRYYFPDYTKLMPDLPDLGDTFEFGKGDNNNTMIKIDDKKCLIVKSKPELTGGNNSIPNYMLTEVTQLYRINEDYAFNKLKINEKTSACEFEGENGYLGFFRDTKTKKMIVDEKKAAEIKKHLLSIMK